MAGNWNDIPPAPGKAQHVRVYFHPDHEGVSLYDCPSFAISQSGDLMLYGVDGNTLIRAYAKGQWIFATMAYQKAEKA